MSDSKEAGAQPAVSAKREFDALASELDYPMFIVTAAAAGERAGCLVGFSTQASIDPPRFLLCISKNNRTYRVASGAGALAVHLVPSYRPELAELFGGQTGDDLDKFARCEWSVGPRGLPLLEGCPSWFACEIVERLDAGDHDAFLLEPFAAHRGHGEEPFPFHRAKRLEPGHEA